MLKAAILISAMCCLSAAPPATKPQPIRVTECFVKVIDQVTLAADQAGVLEFVEPREGDTVAARQRLAGVRDDVAAANVALATAQAEYVAEIAAKEKAHDIAVNEEKQAHLANQTQRNTVPQLEVERLRLAKELASFEIEKARHEHRLSNLRKELAERELEQYVIAAPIGGVITHVYKFKGEAVRAGDPVLELTSTDRVRVEGWLELASGLHVTAGDRVRVQLNIPDVDLPIEQRVFEGKVSFVDVVVEPVSQRIKVWADVVNQDNLLRAGLQADMTIEPSSLAAASR